MSMSVFYYGVCASFPRCALSTNLCVVCVSFLPNARNKIQWNLVLMKGQWTDEIIMFSIRRFRYIEVFFIDR